MPEPGQVKTRLQPSCSPERAAIIARELIIQSLELVTKSWPDELCLHVWPNVEHPFFKDLQSRYGVQLRPQVSGDLGTKMSAAISRGIHKVGAAAVMGCDVPHCPGEILSQAHEVLLRGENVIGLCEDGGYYFLGLTQHAPGLFENIPWGGDKVASATLARARALEISFGLQLPPLRDIDSWEDLEAAAHACQRLLYTLDS